MITIEKARIADSRILTDLVIAIYKENYLYLWHDRGADWYMPTFSLMKEEYRGMVLLTKKA